MTDTQIILKVNKEIDKFIEAQRDVIRSFGNDNPKLLRGNVNVLCGTLTDNINLLEKNKSLAS